MAKFKVNLADRTSGRTQVVELEGPKAQPLVGREIGAEVDGALFGVAGEKVKITGGSDKDGIPLIPSVHGGAKKRIILAGGVGFHPDEDGERRRKIVRGRMIGEETYQINAVILREAGKQVVEEKKAAPVAPSPSPAPKERVPKPKKAERKPKKSKR